MGEHLSTLSGSRMRENRPSGLTSGEWKRNAWRAIQAPATERAGLSYARLPITAPLLDSTTSDAGAPACCRLTRSEWSKPATCRRSGLMVFRAGHEISGLVAFAFALSALPVASAPALRPVVEAEEDVYSYTNADNRAGPLRRHGPQLLGHIAAH